MENKRMIFAEASDRKIKKLVDNSTQRNTQKKIHKICRNDLSTFTLKNQLEGYKIDKPLSSLLVYWRIMPLGLKDCPQDFTVALEASLFG